MAQDVRYVQPAALGGIVEFAVEIALGVSDEGGATGVWAPDPNQALWDTVGVWSGLIPSWIDVTQRVMDAGTTRGRDTWEQQFRVGRASVLVSNQDGLFTPDTLTDVGAVRLRPGRWLRVLGRRTDDGSDWVPLWTGQIDTMADQYDDGAHGINSRIQSLDFGARFQIDDPPELTTPIPAGQNTGDRVNLLLDEAGWPTEAFWRDVETGGNTMAEATLPQSRWAEMQNAATAEGGGMFLAANGVPTFRNKDWLPAIFAGPAKYTIGQPASGVQILTAGTNWSQQRIYNDIRMARKGGTEYRVTDQDSQALYGPRTYSRNDIQCQTDAQLEEIADRYLSVFRFDRARVQELELVPTSPEGVTDLLNTELGDKVTVTVQTRGNGLWAYTADYFVNKVEHQITASDWVTTLRVDVAAFDFPISPGAFTDGFSDGFDVEGIPS